MSRTFVRHKIRDSCAEAAVGEACAKKLVQEARGFGLL